jgi:pseudouridylate synthase / pseudouridine kinase
MPLTCRSRLCGLGHWLRSTGISRHDRRFSTARPLAYGGSLKGILQVSEEVKEALATNRPVVALESTIYTHGAIGKDLALESIVRQHGAVPAVCGIFAGTPKVGLTRAEVQQMVDEGAMKVSRRDLAYLVGTVRQL